MDNLIIQLIELNKVMESVIQQMNDVSADLRKMTMDNSPETQKMVDHLNNVGQGGAGGAGESTGDEDKDLAEGEGKPFNV